MKQVWAFLAVVTSLGLTSTSGSACSIHDQFCQFQGIGRAVNQTIGQNEPTQVIIGSVGSNAVDFDNHVLLPDGNGPYIASSLGYTPRADQPYIGADEQPRHVYPTQFQIDFQNGSAQAQYTGDVTGGAFIPNPSGCTISTATYCEEVIIQGNIPDPGTPEGFVVQQTNHLYNFPNTPNPTIDVVSYGAATGRAYFKQNSHLGFSIDNVEVNGQTYQFTGIRQETLSGTGDQGTEQTYYIGNTDFDPHAAGVVVHYDQTRAIRSVVHDVQFGHVTLPDGRQINQYDGHQRQTTYQQYDRTYDFTQYVYADSRLPALHLTEQETARYDRWSDIYGATHSAEYQAFQAEQAELQRLAQEQFERDWERGCRDSTCSSLSNQTVWPGVDMAVATAADVTSATNIGTITEGRIDQHRTFIDIDGERYLYADDDAPLYVKAGVQFRNLGEYVVENPADAANDALDGTQVALDIYSTGFAVTGIGEPISMAIDGVNGTISGTRGYFSEGDEQQGYYVDASLTYGGILVPFAAGGTLKYADNVVGALPDETLVCRGGLCRAEDFVNGSGVRVDNIGNLNNVSVNVSVRGQIDEAAMGIKNGQVGVTTLGEIRNIGGDVVGSPNPNNPLHADLFGISPDQAEQLFAPTIRNPNKQ